MQSVVHPLGRAVASTPDAIAASSVPGDRALRGMNLGIVSSAHCCADSGTFNESDGALFSHPTCVAFGECGVRGQVAGTVLSAASRCNLTEDERQQDRS
jgi:hypothetical protein